MKKINEKELERVVDIFGDSGSVVVSLNGIIKGNIVLDKVVVRYDYRSGILTASDRINTIEFDMSSVCGIEYSEDDGLLRIEFDYGEEVEVKAKQTKVFKSID